MLIVALPFPVALLGRRCSASAHAPRHHPLDEQPQLAIDVRDARRPLLQMSREPLDPQIEWLDHMRIGGVD